MRTVAALLLFVFTLGCGEESVSKPKQSSASQVSRPPPSSKSQPSSPTPAESTGASKKVAVGKHVSFETMKDGRRALVNATVCLREGQLEQLLCRKQTKEHEAILSADVDARDIHMALLLAGAKPGSPVRYQPKYQPASGSPIKISLQYEEKGKTIVVPAQKWVRNSKTKKDLEHDWVFAGSILIEDPEKKRPPSYLANYGDVICVSNFEDAMLDLPMNSSKDNADLAFEANTERIPPVGTPVVVILEGVGNKE